MNNYKYNQNTHIINIDNLQFARNNGENTNSVEIDAKMHIELNPYNYTWADDPNIVTRNTIFDINKMTMNMVDMTMKKLEGFGYCPKAKCEVSGTIKVPKMDNIRIRQVKTHGEVIYVVYGVEQVEIYISYESNNGFVDAIGTIKNKFWKRDKDFELSKLEYDVSNVIEF